MAAMGDVLCAQFHSEIMWLEKSHRSFEGIRKSTVGPSCFLPVNSSSIEIEMALLKIGFSNHLVPLSLCPHKFSLAKNRINEYLKTDSSLGFRDLWVLLEFNVMSGYYHL